ncbi:hypothetical protein THAOC_13527 [Thalassiosira oceanica]|uniref:Uncharacterized protein n=1 Tax=Thalassiosira oceanica TaxID=159749 RepID=K0SJS8_THAOC|nr:hypothetical protein THAOC_13527 [Thalassiosira oceanica]|eukprot:EJK65595.1 hypothetical protein THAOC_13527 [Thalassiosira oceanica]
MSTAPTALQAICRDSAVRNDLSYHQGDQNWAIRTCLPVASARLASSTLAASRLGGGLVGSIRIVKGSVSKAPSAGASNSSERPHRYPIAHSQLVIFCDATGEGARLAAYGRTRVEIYTLPGQYPSAPLGFLRPPALRLLRLSAPSPS